MAPSIIAVSLDIDSVVRRTFLLRCVFGWFLTQRLNTTEQLANMGSQLLDVLLLPIDHVAQLLIGALEKRHFQFEPLDVLVTHESSSISCIDSDAPRALTCQTPPLHLALRGGE